MTQDQPNRSVSANGAEPSFGHATVPIWIILVFGVMFFWSMIYMDSHAGEFNPRVYRPFRNYADLVAAEPVSKEGDFMAKGETVYKATCSLCHLPTGLGAEGKAPPLAGSEWVLASGPNRIGRIVLNGFTGNVHVSGKVISGLTMPPWKDTYDDAQIAAVLTYVRSHFGNNAGPVKPEQIKAIRADEAKRSGAHTEADLLSLPEQ